MTARPDRSPKESGRRARRRAPLPPLEVLARISRCPVDRFIARLAALLENVERWRGMEYGFRRWGGGPARRLLSRPDLPELLGRIRQGAGAAYCLADELQRRRRELDATAVRKGSRE